MTTASASGASTPAASAPGASVPGTSAPGSGALGSGAPGHGTGGPAPTSIVVGYGFWIFLLSDFIMFSAFFAAFAVLCGATDSGPTGHQLFSMRNAFLETIALLTSSLTCGLMSIAVVRRDARAFYVWGMITGVLGVIFLGLELRELTGFVTTGAGPSRSAFLSSFFALIGLHGVHVTIGVVWLIVMLAQVATRRFEKHVILRLNCFTLFWHALDIIWVALLTNVYLIGGR